MEWKCAFWMTITMSDSMNLDRSWNIRRTAEKDVPEHIHRMPFRPLAKEGLISEKQVHATRSGEPMCHDAARKSTRQGIQAHAGWQCV